MKDIDLTEYKPNSKVNMIELQSFKASGVDKMRHTPNKSLKSYGSKHAILGGINDDLTNLLE